MRNKFVVVDLETSGLDANRDFIVEIGAVKIENGETVGTFSSFAYCEQIQKLPEIVKAFIGITYGDLKNAPPIEEVLAEFKAFAQGYTLVAHNLAFHFGFLRSWGCRCGVKFDSFEKNAIDTLECAKNVLGNKVKDYKISTLADYFGIEFTRHRALNYSETTAKVFTKLVTK